VTLPILHNFEESKLKGLFKLNKPFYDENPEFVKEMMKVENEKAMSEIEV
jgi:hypothetical protein